MISTYSALTLIQFEPYFTTPRTVYDLVTLLRVSFFYARQCRHNCKCRSLRDMFLSMNFKNTTVFVVTKIYVAKFSCVVAF